VSLALSLRSYSLSRFTWFPWRILPFYLILISGLGSWSMLPLFFTHLLGLFVFRLMDDWGCRHFDLKTKNRSLLLESPLLVITCLASSWLVILAGYGGARTFSGGLLLILLSLYLYRKLKDQWIERISFLKYPFFILYPSFELAIKPTHLLLALSTALAFLFYDLKTQEIPLKRSIKYSPYLIFFIPLALSIFMR